MYLNFRFVTVGVAYGAFFYTQSEYPLSVFLTEE